MTDINHQNFAPHSLSWGEKISYGVGDMGFNFYWTNIATFLMFFYTDVFGISAAAAGFMLFAIKIINAFTDPIIGVAADRTTTRFGKFRPYLIWMAIPLAVAGVLTYTTPDLSGKGKLLWAYGNNATHSYRRLLLQIFCQASRLNGCFCSCLHGSGGSRRLAHSSFDTLYRLFYQPRRPERRDCVTL